MEESSKNPFLIKVLNKFCNSIILDNLAIKKEKKKEKKGSTGLPSTEFMIQPESKAYKIDTSK
jgi:hypothetical protein